MAPTVPESADHTDQRRTKSRKPHIRAAFLIDILPITTGMLPIILFLQGRTSLLARRSLEICSLPSETRVQ